jgi:hypothetical protein
MTYPFDKIFSNFKYLSLSTELLEECGWDEDEYENVVNIISAALSDITPTAYMNDFEYIWKPIKNRLYGKLSKNQITIIKKIVAYEWDSIKDHYNQMEN